MQTVDNILKACAAVHPHSLAVTIDLEQATFGDIDQWADAYARSLHDWGMRRGSAVLVVAEMSMDLIHVHFAMARMGVIFIPANPRLSERELTDVVKYLSVERVITDSRNQDLVCEVARSTGIDVAVLAPNASACGVNLRRKAETQLGNAYSHSCARPDDVHAVYLTSGSSGRPKGVELSQRVGWLRAHLNQRLNSSRGTACMFPLYHMAGWQMLNQAWAMRRPIHFVRRPTAASLSHAIDHWQASSLYAIPAVWRKVLAHPTPIGQASLRAIETGTSFAETSLLEALRQRFPNASLGVGYGSTEVGTVAWLSHEDVMRKPGAVGLPASGVSVRVEDGELLVKAETLMNGYYNLPLETADSLQDGWYRTGDLAALDDEGYLSIVGRRREIIRSAGETISPLEVEAPLKDIEGIAELAIVGLPDCDWGEIVCAAVVYAPGSTPVSLGTLRNRLRNVANFKHPRRIVAVDAIPRTAATGQVQRAQLRSTIIEMLESRPSGYHS